MYLQCGKLNCFLDLLSVDNVSKLPNFNMTFVLVSTFTIQSFITYRQSVEKLIVRTCVHNPKFDMYRQCQNLNCFLDLLSTHNVSKLPNFNMTFVLVSTFTIQSFITYRQSVGNLFMRTCVHNPKFDMYR